MYTSVRSIALKLRMRGMSYTEIQKHVPVSKSTLSLWLKNVVISEKARDRLKRRERKAALSALLKRNRAQTTEAKRRASDAQQAGQADIGKMSEIDLRIVGAVLYWAEGYKRLIIKDGIERMGHVISFVNADPFMIWTFVRFLTDILHVPKEKIRLIMRLYPHINESKAKEHWAQATNLPLSCFKKSSYAVSSASGAKRPQYRLPFGTIQVCVNSTERFHYLLGLIEGVKNHLASDILSKRLDSSVS